MKSPVSFDTPKTTSGIKVAPYLTILLDEADALKDSRKTYNLSKDLSGEKQLTLYSAFIDYYLSLDVISKTSNGYYAVNTKNVLHLPILEAKIFDSSNLPRLSSGGFAFPPNTTEYEKGTQGYVQFQKNITTMVSRIVNYAESLEIIEGKWKATKNERIFFTVVSWFVGLNIPVFIATIMGFLDGIFFLGAFISGFLLLATFMYCTIEGLSNYAHQITADGNRLAKELKQYNQVVTASKNGAAYISEYGSSPVRRLLKRS